MPPLPSRLAALGSPSKVGDEHGPWLTRNPNLAGDEEDLARDVRAFPFTNVKVFVVEINPLKYRQHLNNL